MTGLPTSIENYLREAGFSPTELLILRHLLDGEILTLREIAAKTGKSTGVLDQAMKKLISKNILSKKIVNDNPRYLLESVDAISAWVKSDMQQKKESLQRKHQNFESFIASLEIDRVRPEMKYFEGEIGITQAYMRLLEENGDFLCYLPVIHKEEEDPLRDFRVLYFRERHKRKIFLRIIAPDTPLARRFTSRDIFEYRETRCIPDSDFPSSFEKIIAGNVIACFSHAEKKACFIHYPELAGTERKLFEVLWRRAGEKDGTATVNQETDQNRKMIVGIETKTFSALREFFLSKKSIVVLAVLGIASACITTGLFLHTSAINLQRIKEQGMEVSKLSEINSHLFTSILFFTGLFIIFVAIRMAAFHRSLAMEILRIFQFKLVTIAIVVSIILSTTITYGLYLQNLEVSKQQFSKRAMSIASTAILQIDTSDIQAIIANQDPRSLQYDRVFQVLKSVRKRNPDIAYIYILQPNIDPTKFSWIVDADSHPSLPFLEDQNKDGLLNKADESVYPGQSYDVSEISELRIENLVSEPIAITDFYKDQWGEFITGYAPIFIDGHELIAVFGVDFWASEVKHFTFTTFQPIVFFFCMLILFVVIHISVMGKTLINN